MEKFRFLKWKVYEDSKILLRIIFELVKKLPKEYRYELGSQMVRSALSVSLNIAEGSGKTSDAELNRFFNIALGSLNETLAGTDILLYNNFITKDDFNKAYLVINEINNQRGGFKKKLAKADLL